MHRQFSYGFNSRRFPSLSGVPATPYFGSAVAKDHVLTAPVGLCVAKSNRRKARWNWIKAAYWLGEGPKFILKLRRKVRSSITNSSMLSAGWHIFLSVGVACKAALSTRTRFAISEGSKLKIVSAPTVRNRAGRRALWNFILIYCVRKSLAMHRFWVRKIQHPRIDL